MNEIEISDGAAAKAAPPPDWREMLRAAVASPAFVPGVLLAIGLTAVFWSLFVKLPDLWMSEDGYYSHGFLIPLISGYIVYKWWPKLRQTPVKTGWVALVPLLLLFGVVRAAYLTNLTQILALSLIAALLLSIWFVAGWRWMLALSLPVMYLAFALPLWTGAIDVYTNPLQILSTKVAFSLLSTMGFEPYQDNSTTIMLGGFVLDVGIPCSGLKLVLAVTAFTAFFVLIAGLRWWANLLMIALILPLCLFINGLRIALIGMVGDMYGSEAGHTFHDWSGYITLLVCFFLLFKFARWLGWND